MVESFSQASAAKYSGMLGKAFSVFVNTADGVSHSLNINAFASRFGPLCK